MKQYLRFLALLCLFLRVAVCRNTFKGISMLVLILMLSGPFSVAAQDAVTVKGTVVSEPDGEPLAGVNILVKGTTRGVITDANGAFEIEASPDAILVFSFIGYRSQEVQVSGRSELSVELIEDAEMLGEVTVYSTGYQELPAERSTGSFEHIDNKLLNRSVSTDVISRLEGVTNSLLFDTRINATPGAAPPQLRIRGLGSLYGEGFSGVPSSKEAPLVIVDNFPYEGNIENINPNDVKSITILKDAAAASIWGARAGNGVIVITTKKGEYDRPANISFNSNITVGEKPDLFYNPEFLDAGQFIEVVRQLFSQGFYTGEENNQNMPSLSNVVELLIMERDGVITNQELESQLTVLKQQDTRREAEKHLYRKSLNQQYAMNINGGTRSLNYYVSGGYDKNMSHVVGDGSERITINTQSTFRPVKDLELSLGMYYTQNLSRNNGLGLPDLQSYNGYPYLTLADESGRPLPVPYGYRDSYLEQSENMGFLDWRYYPLQEVALRNNTTNEKENRVNVGIGYNIVESLSFNFKYQYQDILGERNFLTDKDSYYIRDLVNRFTQPDGEQVYPHSDMLSVYNTHGESHLGRFQANFDKTINSRHNVVALLGTEVRQHRQRQNSFDLIGYDANVLTYQTQFDYVTRFPVNPRGTSRLPAPNHFLGDRIDRFISYYGNGAYTYSDKYIISGSLRWDASNLFGVKTNQKGVPLWSVGGSWLINEEEFYDVQWLPLLKLRATYGYSGNIDKSVTAYPTATYSTDRLTDLQYARLRSPGNPQLRWEKIKTINAAIDFATRDHKITGSFEYYRKNSTDLIAPIPLDPTTGVLTPFNVNYASLQINGIDLELNTNWQLGQIKWKSGILVNYAKDEVTDFRFDGDGNLTSYTQGNMTLPVVGRPLYTLYSYPWIGLDPATGDPLVQIEDQVNTDYPGYYSQINPVEDLIVHGPKVPPLFGAIMNTLEWKGFSVSANITWKTGYFFRRSALDYYQLFDDAMGHIEFAQRWQNPGDELTTDVPSMPAVANANRDRIYTLSELTVEKGDHIRLQDLNVSYDILKSHWSALPVQKLRIYFYARNLEILWRANDKGLDPDYPSSFYPQPRSFSMGLQLDI